ncbi:Putative ABC transporter substrate-binding protein YesO [Paenibacillus sp. JJ-100]|uniref:ABC transporter substrate-binding protein n=1 Tax=Paenibacillus sp. JJ-100 TaxID=2974896 RepID=UPI0022FF50A4|nr:sugar ABC transporter substrate-binding protein [Paenibacillus sp. JJ-100]CAI6084779.1 Putative ABC transporter substrate-binding protein YesO [Paenibacillus sp. JJ-100]
MIITKKWVTLFCLSLLLFATACSGGTSGTPVSSGDTSEGSTSEKIELRMTWWGSQTRHDLTTQVIKLFEEKHPGITIKPEYSGWDGYFDKLTTQVAGSNAPDIIQMDYAFLTDFARRGALLDLTPYADQELGIKDHDKSMITAGSIDDKLYAITLGVNAPGVVYDATLFQQLGIEEPKESWTWEDFSAIAAQIAAAKGEGFYGTADISGATNMFEVFVRQSGKGLFEDGVMTATSDQLKEWFEMWAALRENGGATSAEVTASTTNALETRPISLGTAAMDFAWSNQLLTFQQVNKNQDHKLGIQVLPHGVNEQRIGEYLKPGQFMSGYSKTKHPKEVAMFIDFMVNDPEATAILGSERGVPVNASIREQLQPQLSEGEKIIFQFIDIVSKHSSEISPPYPQGFAEVDTSFKSASEQIAFGQGSMTDIIHQFIEGAQATLASSQ